MSIHSVLFHLCFFMEHAFFLLLHINVAVMSHKGNATALQNTQVSVEHNRQSNGVMSSVTCKHKNWLLMLQKRLHYQERGDQP